MKNKIIKLLVKAYGNEWFNLFSVMLATVLGYTQMWPSIVFVGLFMAGSAVAIRNKNKKLTK
jgi:hypothetical protein